MSDSRHVSEERPAFRSFFPNEEAAEYAERALIRLYEETARVKRDASHPLGFRATAWQVACWAAGVMYPADENEQGAVVAAWEKNFMFGLVASDALGCVSPRERVFDRDRSGFHERYYITDAGKEYVALLEGTG